MLKRRKQVTLRDLESQLGIGHQNGFHKLLFLTTINDFIYPENLFKSQKNIKCIESDVHAKSKILVNMNSKKYES